MAFGLVLSRFEACAALKEIHLKLLGEGSEVGERVAFGEQLREPTEADGLPEGLKVNIETWPKPCEQARFHAETCTSTLFSLNWHLLDLPSVF